MTRQDVLDQFPEATKDQISALLNIHSADIGKAKGDTAQLQADLQAAHVTGLPLSSYYCGCSIKSPAISR